MKAAYLDPRVELDRKTGKVRAEFEVRNQSGETWRAAEGFFLGVHLFDADSGTLIVDGDRVAPEHDLAPGESSRIAIELAIPPDNGRFQALISPMREHVCWYYEQGWPFLLVEAVVRDGAARLQRVKVATLSALDREKAVRAVGRAFTYPFLTLWRNRGLIRVMVRRDVLGRYRGSFAGSFWTLINPLLLMLTYYFVFGVVLQSRFPGDPSRGGFALYFLAGMLPWLAVSEAAGRAPTILLEHRNFVKKLVFAVETLPVNLVAAGLVSEFFAVVLYCGFLLALRHSLPVTVLWLPVLVVPQILFTLGLSWLLAALGAFVRDLGQIIGFLLTIWFFVTPICYPEGSLPGGAATLLRKNPLYVLVRGYRAIFLENRAPEFGPLWKLTVVALAALVIGHACFYKLRRSFADML